MRKLITCATLAAALAATTAGTAKAVPPACFTLATRALTGPAGGDVSLAISPLRAECVVPSSLKRVRLKTFGLDGKVTGVRNLTGVPITAGHATIGLGRLARGQRVEVDVLIDAGDLEHLYVLQDAAVARLRPDLVVSLAGPPRLLAGNHGTIVATIAERNGDTGAAATVALSADGQVLASRAVQVPAGANATASFDVSFETATDVVLRAVVTDADPGETDEANNAARRELEVTDAELDASTVIVPSLAGYGGQFNHRIYSKLGGDVGITPENLPDLEQKVVDLKPQFSRIFVNDNDLKDPDRLQSFKRTVELAQRAGTAINVTWQGGTLDVKTGSIPRLADALVDLVQNRGVTKLVWLTLQNEPNSTSLTPAAYEERYRALDPYLLPIRAQVRYMGGDLVRDGQRAWFDYMATHMADILDAWSMHAFWDYWDTPKLQDRIAEVRAIWNLEPPAGRKPLYVTEYGVRGLRTFDGVKADPGFWANGTPLTQTNVNAFQHAWFDVLSARAGYLGTVKWDSYFGKYDNSPQAYYMIGPPPLWAEYPVYWVLRLWTSSVKPSWQVVGLDLAGGPKVATAYRGPADALTVIGLDRDGAQLNGASGTDVQYRVGGVAPNQTLQLKVWNATGDGTIAPARTVTADDAGVATFSVPLQGVFALTRRGV